MALVTLPVKEVPKMTRWGRRHSPRVADGGAAVLAKLVRSPGYFAIELKTGKFQPEHAGKLDFYIDLVDDRLRREAHADTIGILICDSENDHAVRHSIGRATSPMAVTSCTYDALLTEVRNEIPDASRLTAALDWTNDSTS